MAPVPGAAAAALLAAVLLLACSPVCQARSASRLGEASSGLRRLLSYAIVWPVTVESQCYSELSFYLLVNFDTYGHNGPLCLDVPEPALCQEYFVLGPNATMSAAYASISTKAWLLLEDTDSFARPATYTDGDGSLQYATVFNDPCQAGTEGCLPKFKICVPGCRKKVDVSQGPVVLSCEEPITAFAPTAAQELQADAPAPPP